MSNQYEIKFFEDFLKVPFDRLDDCLKEINEAIKTGSALYQIQKLIDPNAPFEFQKFIWTDDNDPSNTKIHLVPIDGSKESK